MYPFYAAQFIIMQDGERRVTSVGVRAQDLGICGIVGVGSNPAHNNIYGGFIIFAPILFYKI